MTYLLFDTSTPMCRIMLVRDGVATEHTWEAGRMLAKELLGYIDEVMQGAGMNYTAIAGIGILRGPGSFTGLRIGITVANTIASARAIPIVGTIGDDWQQAAINNLEQGDNDLIVLPEYGSDVRITTPRK